MQLTGWGCGGARKIIGLFELPLPAADAQALGYQIWRIINETILGYNGGP